MKSSSLLILISMLISACAGLVFYGITQGFIIIHVPKTVSGHATQISPAHTQQQVPISFTTLDTSGAQTQERRDLTCNAVLEHCITTAINAYCAALYERNMISRSIVVTVPQSFNQETAWLSFSHSPLPKHGSIQDKTHIVKNIINIVKQVAPSVQRILFLHNHAPLRDEHLDFSYPWHISALDTVPNELVHASRPKVQNPFVLCIDVSHTPGRPIGDVYEKGVALQCALAIKEHLATLCSDIEVHVAQNMKNGQYSYASYSNQLSPDWHIYLSIAPTNDRSTATWITRRYDPVPYKNSYNSLSKKHRCIPLHEAYLYANEASIWYTATVHSIMKNTRPAPCTTAEPIVLPYAPLLGICAPASALEIRITSADEWKQLVPLIAEAIHATAHSDATE